MIMIIQQKCSCGWLIYIWPETALVFRISYVNYLKNKLGMTVSSVGI